MARNRRIVLASRPQGAAATSNTLAGSRFGIPVRGTMAHSWVESFPTELDSFRAFGRVYPGNCILLVDTYDTLEGVKTALDAIRELGIKASGVAAKVATLSGRRLLIMT